MGRAGQLWEARLPTFDGRPVEVGIDEAGRGPVLGPMVYGLAVSPVEDRDALVARKFDDSKALTEEDRKRMFAEIKAADGLGFVTQVLSPELIGANMLRRTAKYDLNRMSHDCAISMIRHVLSEGVNVSEIYVDTVGDPERYEQKLSAIFPKQRVFVRKKADSLFAVVSAASICAKVTRDNLLASWKPDGSWDSKLMEKPLGSGYPADPTTKEWLAAAQDSVFGFPRLVRFSWSTAAELMKEKSHASDFHDEKLEEGQTSIVSFAKPELHPRKKFFTSRRLAVVSAF
jgi:ribonuclease H2 subunit A